MSIDILKSPVSAFASAKKKRNMNRTLLVLAKSSVLFAISAALVSGRIVYSSLGATGIASISAFVFLLSFLTLMLAGWVIDIVARMLAGKGDYFDGLTVVSYSSLFLSAGFFIASALVFIPVAGILLGMIALLPAFAAGFSCLYRGVKDMYRTDMVTAFVTISVVTLTLVMAIQAAVLLGVANVSGLMPMMGIA